MRRRDVLKLLAGVVIAAPCRSSRSLPRRRIASPRLWGRRDYRRHPLGEDPHKGVGGTRLYAWSELGNSSIRRQHATCPVAATGTRYCREQGGCGSCHRLSADRCDERYRRSYGCRHPAQVIQSQPASSPVWRGQEAM